MNTVNQIFQSHSPNDNHNKNQGHTIKLHSFLVGRQFDDSSRSEDLSLMSEDLTNRTHAHLFEKDKAGLWATFFNLITSYLGSGILALPFAYKKSGILTGVVSTLLIAILSNYCIRLLLKCKYILVNLTSETHPNGAQTIGYAEIAAAVDGRRGEWFVHGLLVFVQFGVGVVYLIFIGGNLESLLPIQSSYILIFVTIPLAIFALFKSMKHLAMFGLIAQVSILTGLFIISGYAFADRLHSKQERDISIYPTKQFAFFFGIAIYTYEGIGLALPIESAMKDRSKYVSLLDKCFIFVTLLFLGFGAGVYAGFGDDTQQVITLSLPLHDRLAELVKITLCVCLTCTYPLMLKPVYDLVERLSSERLGKRAKWTRPLIACSTTTVAILVPQFAHLMGILGSIGGTTLAFTLPARYYLKLSNTKSALEKTILYAIQIIGIVAGLFSAYVVFTGMISEA